MTTPKDIIGDAQELSMLGTAHLLVGKRRYDVKALSQALLIAVEALEKHQRFPIDQDDGVRAKDIADKTLSRIRSLPL